MAHPSSAKQIMRATKMMQYYIEVDHMALPLKEELLSASKNDILYRARRPCCSGVRVLGPGPFGRGVRGFIGLMV